MTRDEVAAELERFAVEVERLPGVSRRNPHAFAEEKSDVVGKMRRRAVELRTGAAAPTGRLNPVRAGAIHTGVIVAHGRAIRVETRARRV